MFLLVLLISLFVYSCENKIERTYPLSLNYDFLSIGELRNKNVTSGNYNIEGYVVKIYTCPPCPKNAFCKPCASDHILISEDDNITTYDKGVTVLVDNPKQFELNKKYKFSLEFLQSSNVEGNTYLSFRLLGYELLQ